MSQGRHKRISKTMAYLLRHDPEGMEVDEEGFVEMGGLLERLNQRDFNVSEQDVRRITDRDPKGRYEIVDGRIRARYGHSIDVDPTLSSGSVPRVLYHGTSPKAAGRILKEGLRAKGRQKVHLSPTIDLARSVGRRHCSKPVILEIDSSAARDRGVQISRASEAVYVSEEIPPDAIRPMNRSRS